jgi:hypothetical protein
MHIRLPSDQKPPTTLELIDQGSGDKKEPPQRQRPNALPQSPQPRLQLSQLTKSLMTSAVMPNSASLMSLSSNTERHYAHQLVRSASTPVLHQQVLWQEVAQGETDRG